MDRSVKVAVGVGVAIARAEGRELLLVQRRRHGAGSWATPGGYLDPGESFEACAVREVAEEVGVAITDVTYLGVVNDIHPDGKHTVTIWLSARVVAGEPRVAAPDELSDVGWFPLAALPEPIYLSTANFLAGRTQPPFANRAVLSDE